MEIEVPAKVMARLLASVDSSAKRAVSRTMTVMANEHATKVKRDSFRGDRLRRRTGLLRNSIRTTPAREGEARPTASSFVAGVKYAAIQEHGGTIRPTKGQYLTVPLDAAQTARGVTRAAAKLEQGPGGWRTAQRVPDAADRETWIRRGRTGTPIIYVKGKDGAPLPLYALVREVRIPGRFGFYDTWDELAPRRERQWSYALDQIERSLREGRA